MTFINEFYRFNIDTNEKFNYIINSKINSVLTLIYAISFSSMGRL